MTDTASAIERIHKWDINKQQIYSFHSSLFTMQDTKIFFIQPNINLLYILLAIS